MGHVLLVASRSENVESRASVLELGGLVAKVMDVESFAIENAFGLLGEADGDRLVALVDLGATVTTLHVLRHGRTLYTRQKEFGGKQLHEEIMRGHGLTLDKAHQDT